MSFSARSRRAAASLALWPVDAAVVSSFYRPDGAVRPAVGGAGGTGWGATGGVHRAGVAAWRRSAGAWLGSSAAMSAAARIDVAGEVSPVPVVAWTRPLEDFVRAFAAAGLAITGIREPHPSEQQLRDDPWWAENFTRPLFMLITATRTA